MGSLVSKMRGGERECVMGEKSDILFSYGSRLRERRCVKHCKRNANLALVRCGSEVANLAPATLWMTL